MSRPRFQILDLLRGFLFLNMAAYHLLYDWVFLFWSALRLSTEPVRLSLAAAYLQRLYPAGGLLLHAEPPACQTRLADFGLRFGYHRCHMADYAAGAHSIRHFAFYRFVLSADWAVKAGIPFVACLAHVVAICTAICCYQGHLLRVSGDFALRPLAVAGPMLSIGLALSPGLPSASFFSGDYFPLIPWFFLFLAGYWGGPLLLQSKLFANIQHWQLPALNWIGRHTLALYMLHQPVIYGFLLLLFQ